MPAKNKVRSKGGQAASPAYDDNYKDNTQVSKNDRLPFRETATPKLGNHKASDLSWS